MKPRGINEKEWNEIFPPDRENIARVTAIFFRKGDQLDIAFSKAKDYHDYHVFFQEETQKSKYAKELYPYFPGVAEYQKVPLSIKNCVNAIFDTAKTFANEIVNATDKDIFINRIWKNRKNKCLVSGEEIENDEDALTFQSSQILKKYIPNMKYIGPLWCQFTREESIATVKKNKQYETNENDLSDADNYWTDSDFIPSKIMEDDIPF